MAGFGKSSRPGKRGSSSSGYSSYLSTVSVVVLLAMCLLGFWMLTSSSIIPSQVTISNTSATGRLSRSTVTSSSSSSATDDNPGSLAEDAIKGDSEPVTEEEADDKAGSKIAEVTQKEDLGAGADVESRSESKVGEEFEENQHHPQQNTEEETSRNEEETQTVREQEQASGNEEEAQQQQIQENGVHDQQQEEHDSDGTTDGGQQQEESGIQREQQTNDEQTSSQEEQQMGNNGEENQQESQEQKTENGGDENQQLSQTETEENHDQLRQQQMEEGGGGSQSQSEQQEEGNDGSLSNSNQQLEDGGSETQPSSKQKMEEGTSDNQSESQQLADTQGSSKDQQRSSQQQIEEDSPTVNSDETQQPNKEKLSDPNAGDSLPDGARSEVSNNGDGKKRPWATQEDHSDNEKERREEEAQANGGGESSGDVANLYQYEWELCNVTAGPDYIPCLDNQKAIRQLHSFRHFEHRERHCPEESPTCLVPLPKGYKRSIEWPKSRDRIWYNNVPHTKLAEVKGHQNWVKATGQYLTFPGGGTQFIHGALHYIDFIQQAVRDIAWGKHTRVILDVGCGVASFGGYLFERDVLAMSFAPKDEHEAQVQFALERGIPAISAVMGSQRLPFPGRVFDLVHCARCRVPWHADGGTLLLELNRVLRPGGYFVWSATPVYQKLKEDVEIWKAMTSLTMSMCWDLVTIKKDKLNSVAAAIYRKPISNECYDKRKKHNSPPMCKADDDPNAAWYIPLQACMHRVPVDASERGSRWPEVWPRRVEVPPYWLNSLQIGVYGKPAPEDFRADYEHWKGIVRKSYLSGLGISWSKVRNVMDMRAVYGGFAAALKDLKVWVMNVVNIDSPDTLPIIYERGLFGIYHDWCESFSTYPRTYDLLHADRLFSRLKTRCSIIPVMAEVDRIVRPGGKLIVRDESGVVSEVENLLKSLHWEIRLTFSKDQEGILSAEKSDWRPEKYADSS